MPTSTDNLLYGNAERHVKRREGWRKFLSSGTIGAVIMVLAAVAALILANSPAYEVYESLLEFDLGITLSGFGQEFYLGLTLGEWVNSVLMTLFFLCVGLEIKYEMFVGELRDVRKALLPIIAACGGVLMPIIIYTCFNFGTEHAHGFGIPMATDIAFSLAVLSLVGRGIPRGITVFLQTLAIADDIMAIVVIALFYGESPDLMYLACAAAVVVVLVALNLAHVYSLAPYMLLGIVLWACVFLSGVEATIAGVVLAFTIPTKSHINPRIFGKWTIAKVLEARDRYIPGEPILGQDEFARTTRVISRVSRRVEAPLTRLDSTLAPWSNFVILPVFAFFNAGVHLAGVDPVAVVSDRVTLGVFFGLLVGKPVGIFLASFICIKTGLTPMPSGCNFKHVLGAGMLGGIGFTMAIYVANLSFVGPDVATVTDMAKAAILSASTASGVIGVLFMKGVIAGDKRRGAVFAPEPSVQEEAAEGLEVLADISEEEADTDELEDGLVLTNRLGAVSDEALIKSFLEAAGSEEGAWGPAPAASDAADDAAGEAAGNKRADGAVAGGKEDGR